MHAWEAYKGATPQCETHTLQQTMTVTPPSTPACQPAFQPSTLLVSAAPKATQRPTQHRSCTCVVRDGGDRCKSAKPPGLFWDSCLKHVQSALMLPLRGRPGGGSVMETGKNRGQGRNTLNTTTHAQFMFQNKHSGSRSRQCALHQRL